MTDNTLPTTHVYDPLKGASPADLARLTDTLNDLLPAGASGLVLPDKFPIALTPAQETDLKDRLKKFSFRELSLQGITQMAAEPELALNRVLDGFLARVNKGDSTLLFNLVTELNQKIEDERLPDLAKKILEPKPSLGIRIIGVFLPKVRANAVARLFDEAARLASGKSKSIGDLVNGMETKLRREMTDVNQELRQMDAVKDAYRLSFVSFAEETAFLVNALAKAKAEFEAMKPELEKDQLQFQEAEDKLQALESRALAVEATLTRLPADQLVIRQLQNAGVSTLQELSTTMAGRFASVKMTLLTLHGALKVQNLQRLGEQGAHLDANLQRVKGMLMKDVVTTAAVAPGNNRLTAARDLEKAVLEAKGLVTIAEEARVTNRAKFQEARELMAKARSEMLTLSHSVDPRATVAARTY